MPSQSPVAALATNSLRRALESRSRSATRIGGRVELEPLAGELVEHVVQDHHRRLRRGAESAQLHRGHDHRGGLAGADRVASSARPSVRMRATAALVVAG